jgi:hypothetical protein
MNVGFILGYESEGNMVYRIEAVEYSGNKGILHFQKRCKTLVEAEKVYESCLDKYTCHITLTDESNVQTKGMFSWGYKLIKFRKSKKLKNKKEVRK